MRICIALAAGFALDLMFGDPHSLIHPVQIIGWFISAIKKGFQRLIYGCSWEEALERKKKRKPAAEWLAGWLLMILIVAGTYGLVWGILFLAEKIHPWLARGLEILFIYQILATKSLKKESMKVYARLKEGDLAGARKEISYLVGRDTNQLDESEIAKADIETIAENTADGVIAPMFFIALGGAPLGFAYKAVNTLDSMVAYRNEELKYIGFASAKADDIANFIPARLAAVMMMLASLMPGMNFRGAVRIFFRDRYKHLSPNSAQTEAVAAGALDLQLGGTHTYFGKIVEKPTIGDNIRPVEYNDIRRMNRLMYMSAFLSLLVCCGIAYGVSIWI